MYIKFDFPLAFLILLTIILMGCKTTQNSTRNNHQNDTSVNPNPMLTFDINNKEIDYGPLANGYVKQDQDFNLSLINYNPLLLKVSASNTLLTNYITESAGNNINAYVMIDAKIANNATPSGLGSSDKKDTAKVPPELLDIVKNLSDQISLLNKDVQSINDYYNILLGFSGLVKEWKKQINLTEITVTNALKKLNNNLGDNINEVYQSHPGHLNPFSSNVIGTHDNFTLTSDVLISAPQKYIVITQQDLQRLNELINTIDKFKAKNSKEIDRFINSKEVSDEINYATYDSYFKYLTNSTQIFQKFMSDYTTAYSKNISDLVDNVSLVKNLRFTENFGPFSLGGEDEMIIKISAMNTLTNDDIFKNYKGILVKRKKGIKIDFSAGIFGSGLYDNEYVTSQFSQIVQDTTVVDNEIKIGPKQQTFSTIIRRKNAKFSYGPIAFIHFHSMRNSWVNLGGYIGTGLLFKEDSKPVLSVGLNALMGNYQRVIVGIGAASANVTRLSSKYEVGKSYPETITDVPKESQIKVSWLVSLSWNLTKNNPEKK